jgi:hypothetical protein
MFPTSHAVVGDGRSGTLQQQDSTQADGTPTNTKIKNRLEGAGQKVLDGGVAAHIVPNIQTPWAAPLNCLKVAQTHVVSDVHDPLRITQGIMCSGRSSRKDSQT